MEGAVEAQREKVRRSRGTETSIACCSKKKSSHRVDPPPVETPHAVDSNNRGQAIPPGRSGGSSTGSAVAAAAAMSTMHEGVVARAGGRGGGGLPADAEGDTRTSSVFVWPGKLEATAEPGLQARVSYRLTCVRATAFCARFGGARNALLAGTRAGMALVFDWGCLLRGGTGGGSDGGGTGAFVGGKEGRGAAAGKAGSGDEMLLPSAQVRRFLAR